MTITKIKEALDIQKENIKLKADNALLLKIAEAAEKLQHNVAEGDAEHRAGFPVIWSILSSYVIQLRAALQDKQGCADVQCILQQSRREVWDEVMRKFEKGEKSE